MQILKLMTTQNYSTSSIWRNTKIGKLMFAVFQKKDFGMTLIVVNLSLILTKGMGSLN